MPGKTLDLAYYCVLYVDVLGQSEKLRELRALPEDEKEFAATIDILRHTVGFVENLRGWFKEFFQAFAAETDWARRQPDDIKSAIASLLQSHIHFHVFSDSIQISICLQDSATEQSMPINGVATAILAASGMHLFALSVGKPIRGGIDVGLAVPLDTGEIYGPALARAVHLEATAAGYPRIVVGDELLEYLHSVASQEARTVHGEFARQVASSTRRLIYRDADGRFALDFLGTEMQRHSVGAIDSKVVRTASNFVRQQKTRFQTEGNAKLEARYEALWAYFASRASIWGVDLTDIAQ